VHGGKINEREIEKGRRREREREREREKLNAWERESVGERRNELRCAKIILINGSKFARRITATAVKVRYRIAFFFGGEEVPRRA
jgi:hypothetical protein